MPRPHLALRNGPPYLRPITHAPTPLPRQHFPRSLSPHRAGLPKAEVEPVRPGALICSWSHPLSRSRGKARCSRKPKYPTATDATAGDRGVTAGGKYLGVARSLSCLRQSGERPLRKKNTGEKTLPWDRAAREPHASCNILQGSTHTRYGTRPTDPAERPIPV